LLLQKAKIIKKNYTFITVASGTSLEKTSSCL